MNFSDSNEKPISNDGILHSLYKCHTNNTDKGYFYFTCDKTLKTIQCLDLNEGHRHDSISINSSSI